MWQGKGGDEWWPKGEVVLDSKGEVVEGVVPWGQTGSTCGIKIFNASEEHFGQWIVHTKEAGVTILLLLDTQDEVLSPHLLKLFLRLLMV